METKIYTEIHTSYIPEDDITIIWQDMYRTDGNTTDCIQRVVIGWYYGEPDERCTADFSDSALIANYVDCEN